MNADRTPSAAQVCEFCGREVHTRLCDCNPIESECEGSPPVSGGPVKPNQGTVRFRSAGGDQAAAQGLQLPDFASLTTEDIFDMVREYRGAPSNTASAMTVEEWREAWLAEWQRANRAEVAVEEIMAALRSMRELASVAHNGDPWYAENEGLDAGAIFKQAREALGEPDA